MTLAIILSVALAVFAIYPLISLYLSAQNAVTAYGVLKGLPVPFKERLAACWQGFRHGFKRDMSKYGRSLVNSVKVTASWLVVLSVFFLLVVPGLAIGTVWGLIKFFVSTVYSVAEGTAKATDDTLEDWMVAACKPAERTMGR
ncbi:hypothetical protein [Variovorax sp. PMC12]|uniref:hypothetical protein n=1 Tax=Variovorax sp. PMC12 TaxID=2126319 RepID=UPI000D137ACC|nr:hypothetical protein [Variovorax sp. PMC12]AVQ80747.1 hypothetical protein C4F17_07170 [Variovorax sp. PMC12]